MKAAFSEPAKNDPGCEIRLGVASWDQGNGTAQAVKYTWFDKNGKAARGGEFPVEALPQALDFAIRRGYITLASAPTMEATSPEGFQEKRIRAMLRNEAQRHNYYVALDLLVRDGREVVREALPLLSGSEVPDGNYTLHYNWLDESPERSVRVIGGRLEPVPEG
ncbi:MAG: hypothetical protein WA383_13860 [Terriglobales bacterium]|jgi:hypothetical protein